MANKLKNLLEKVTWTQAVFLVGAAFAFYYFAQDTSLVESRKDAIASSVQTLANLEKKLAEAKKFELEYDAKKKHFAELVKELQALQGALPRQFFLPDLLSDILRESKQLEIEITQIVPDGKEEPQELYSSLGFNLEAKGTFLQFFILMDRLASMKRLIGITTIKLIRDPERVSVSLGGEEGAFAGTNMSGGRQTFSGIKATIRLLTYRYKGTDKAASPEVTPAKGG